jgi:CBS domain-containing protein
VRDAAILLSTNKISGAPVVNAEGKMIGVISESDLLSKTRMRHALPPVAAFGLISLPTDELLKIYQNGATLLIADMMTPDVLTVEEDTPLPLVAELLVSEQINRVPVLRDGALVGIITREDVLRGMFDL